jgi:histidinol-phosphate aminotransferase
VSTRPRVAPRPRPDVDAVPAYRPGRSAAQAEADHGIVGAVKLASNELPFDPLPSVTTALEAAARGLPAYPDHRATAVRERLAGRLDVPVEQVAVGAAASGILRQLADAYLAPGDGTVFADPSFEAYPILTELAGARWEKVRGDGLVAHVQGLAAACTDRTRLVLLANPNNPTGTAVTGDEVGWLADHVPDGCLLVVDEAYHEFVTDPKVGTAADLVDRHPNVVTVRTFSKAYGLAGLRIGYAVAEPSVVAALDKVLVPFSVGSLAQAAALASLEASGDMAARVTAVVAERQRVLGELGGAGWEVPGSETNFVWLPVGAGGGGLAVDLERLGVVTRPIEGYGVRVTVADPASNDRFLDALAAVTAGAGGGAHRLPA